jgi:Uma2 family endonuclease
MVATLLPTFSKQTQPGLSRPSALVWTPEEFDRLVGMGLFENRKVELINGELLERGEMNDLHAYGVQLATYACMQVFKPDEFTVRVQLPMRLPSGSRPFPDLVVIRGTPRQMQQHPTTAELIIEVADSTLDFDRIEKAELYALNEIPEYWIVNLAAGVLEVHRQPMRQGDRAKYGEIRTLTIDQSLSPLAVQSVVIKVAELLPAVQS